MNSRPKSVISWDLPPPFPNPVFVRFFPRRSVISRRGRARRGGAFGSRAAIRFLSEWAANAAACRPAATLRTKFTRPVWRRARWRRRVRKCRAHRFVFRTSAKLSGKITEAALPTWRAARRVRRDRLLLRLPSPPPRSDVRGHSSRRRRVQPILFGLMATPQGRRLRAVGPQASHVRCLDA